MRSILRDTWPLLLALGALACSSKAEEAPPVGDPGCDKNALSLSGDIDGTSVDEAWDASSVVMLQVSAPYQVDVAFGSGGVLHLEWNTLLSEGYESAAVGSITMPSGAPRETERFCATGGSTFRRVATGHRVTLDTLSLSTGGGCPGSAVSGKLTGCVRGAD